MDRLQIALKKRDYQKKKTKMETQNWDLKGELGLKKKNKMKELYEKYRVKKKGLKTVIEELKQSMLEKSAKVKIYEQRIEQFRQSVIFDLNQKKIDTELNRNGIRLNGVLNAEECTKFWMTNE